MRWLQRLFDLLLIIGVCLVVCSSLPIKSRSTEIKVNTKHMHEITPEQFDQIHKYHAPKHSPQSVRSLCIARTN